jgi:hypothetical protein
MYNFTCRAAQQTFNVRESNHNRTEEVLVSFTGPKPRAVWYPEDATP